MNAAYLRSLSYDPFHNLAVEEYLLNRGGEEPVLFLWQSGNAVVIGRHQNPWREVHGELMARRGVTLARRVSGGGAVYQDAGNLNFSFIAERRLFDPARQTGGVAESVRALGIDVAVGRRMGLYSGGRKISGSAFAYRRDRALHHGTLLVSADLGMMGVLRGRMRISRQRGMLSESADVANLTASGRVISIEGMARAVREKCAELLGWQFRDVEEEDLCDTLALGVIREKHGSWEWRYGSTPPFTAEFGDGAERLTVNVRGGRVDAVSRQPGENVVDRPGAVRFHRGEVLDALAGTWNDGQALMGDIIF